MILIGDETYMTFITLESKDQSPKKFKHAPSKEKVRATSFCVKSLPWQTIDGCVCNELIRIAPDNLIGTKLSFTIDSHRIIRIRRHAGERCLPECVIERHSGLTTGVVVWDVIPYHERSNLQRIEDIPGAIFQQPNTHLRVTKTIRDFCSAQHMQLLHWPSYLPDMSPIELMWDLFGRPLARDPRPAAYNSDDSFMVLHFLQTAV
ncbi:transposable element Tcb2 transposase [Trichonephila clavipes]|nr:transposable element Tcb2 transposase [Trichonephila clavipes]